MSSTLARKLAEAPPVTFEPKKQATKTGGKPLRVEVEKGAVMHPSLVSEDSRVVRLLKSAGVAMKWISFGCL